MALLGLAWLGLEQNYYDARFELSLFTNGVLNTKTKNIFKPVYVMRCTSVLKQSLALTSAACIKESSFVHQCVSVAK